MKTSKLQAFALATLLLSGAVTGADIIRKSKCSRILKRKVHFTKRNV